MDQATGRQAAEDLKNGNPAQRQVSPERQIELSKTYSAADCQPGEQLTHDERWHDALAAKRQRDALNEATKESAGMAGSGELRAGGQAAQRNSRVASDAPIPDNRKARRILARYGTLDEIREFIEEFGYNCDVDEFIRRFRPGSARKTSALRSV